MKLITVPVGEIRQYKNNPRYITDEAVEAVMESIRQTEYISPIILDEDNVVLAGHTRLKALYQLGYDKIDCVRVEGLTEDQKKKFRLLDNKTAEIATWDLDKLKEELDGLDFGNFDYWSKELEKMGDKMIEGNQRPEEKIIRCPRCGKIVVGPASDYEDDEFAPEYEDGGTL